MAHKHSRMAAILLSALAMTGCCHPWFRDRCCCPPAPVAAPCCQPCCPCPAGPVTPVPAVGPAPQFQRAYTAPQCCQ
jgi:hypothetical protein